MIVQKIKNIIKKRFSRLYAIRQEFLKVNPIFDTRYLDKKIGDHALSIVRRPRTVGSINNHNIALLASELYDMGGHTELLKNFVQALPKEYNCKIFLTRKTQSEQNLVYKIAEIIQYTEIGGVDFYWKNEKKLLNNVFKQIMAFAPQKLITFIHMDDAFAVALLALIKKYTQTAIVFCNIGSHHASLGMSFAHLIGEGMPSTAFVTQKFRGFKNTKVLGLCHLTKAQLPVFKAQEVSKTRRELGIPDHSFCTMTGCSSYKLFENGLSPYFEMIKNLLDKNQDIYHILVTQLNSEQKHIVDTLQIPDRLIVTDFKPNFKLFFKCADVFIDSYPVSSALTIVDLMSLNIPFVSCRNKDNLTYTFFEYLPKNYDYLYDNIFDMQAGIEKLLSNKEERERIENANYAYYLENFEGSIAVRRILEADTFDPEIDEAEYKDFKEIKLMPWGK